jgi:hypothetical protein
MSASGAHAAGLLVSPTSIASTHSGNVTLTITGVSAGATVTAELFMDFDGNGAVDTGEPLIRRFNVTDGQLPLIGGVRNGNVPGDDDGVANGQLTVNVPYRKTNEPDHFSGQFVWRVSSPTSQFSEVLSPLQVTSPSPAQPVTVTGTVIGGGFCTVVLVNPNREDGLVTGTLTDAGGNYTLVAAPGTYIVSPTRCSGGVGFISDFSNPAVISFPSGGTTNGLNFSVTASTRSITGRVTDDLGNGLGGMKVEGSSTNSLFALTFTDANGNYTLSATSSEWEVEVSSWGLALGGYVGLHQATVINTTTGNVANVNLIAPRANALIYGTASEGGTNFVGLVQIEGVNEPSHTYEAASVTDASGNYWLGVFGANWSLGANSADALQAGFITRGTNTTVATNAAVRADISARAATGTVTGRLVNESGQPQGGLDVFINEIPSFVQSQGRSSNQDGTFTLGWFTGNWFLGVNLAQATNRNLLPPSLNFTNGGSSNLANVNVVLKNMNSTLHGTLRDNLGNPVTNQTVSASANVSGTNYFASGLTDASGNYIIRLFSFNNWNVSTFGMPSARGLQDAFYPANNLASGSNFLALVTTATGNVAYVTSAGPINSAVINSPYSFQFQAVGGFLPHSWQLAPASGSLPAGLSLDGGGLISGTPTANGTFNFTVRVNDLTSAFVDRTFSLVVGALDTTPPTLVQTTPQNFQQGIQTHSGIAFTFSEPMQANQSITWSGNVNPANFRYDWATNGLTLFCTYNGLLPTSSTISWTLNPTGQSLFRDLAGNSLPADITGSFKTVATNATGVPDVLELIVFKVANFVQTNTTTADVVPLTTNTHSYGVNIRLSGHITVTNIPSDINGSLFSYVPFDGSEGDSYEFESAAFTSKAQMDAAYPNGSHNFSLRTVHNGTNNVTVTLNGDAYPAAPFVSNFAAAQSVNSSNSFALNWNAFAGGTTDDLIFVEINEPLTNGAFLDIYRSPNPGEPGALNGTATSVTIPSGTFAAGAVYNVNITFVKVTFSSTVGYPPLVAGYYGAETSFKLLTAGSPAQPSLAFTVVPGETHRHVLVTGEPFRQYQLQAATNLSTPVWQSVSTLRTIGRTNVFDDPASPSHPRRYYRAILIRDN